MSTADDEAARQAVSGPGPVAPLTRLEQWPYGFGFFQATRLIYRTLGWSPQASPTEIGPLRFATPATLAFPPNEIHALEALVERTAEQTADRPASSYLMTVSFMGLTGPSGVMPRYYTEWLIARKQARDVAAQQFFDLFNQRLISLFWRAWAKYRADIGLEFDLPNGVLRYVYDLVGMGTPSLRRRLEAKPRSKAAPAVAVSAAGPAAGTGRRLPGTALAYYSGLISQRPHGIGSVSQVLGDFIGAPVEVEACFGTWQAIPLRDRTRLGRVTAKLGDGCVLGRAIWDHQTSMRIRIGPLSYPQFHSLLPCGTRLAEVVELTRFLTGLAIDLRFKLGLESGEVEPLRCGADGDRAARLGWNTWLAGRRRQAPADECEFHFSALSSVPVSSAAPSSARPSPQSSSQSSTFGETSWR